MRLKVSSFIALINIKMREFFEKCLCKFEENLEKT